MKKILFLLAVLIGVATASASDTYTRDVNVLPVAARTVLKSNFKAGVNHIKVDKDWNRVSEYDVVLTDGSEITFDKNGNWKEVEVSGNSSVPAAFVPATISNYVKANHKNARIVGIEKKRSGYDVELSNGIDMKFNSAGVFQRYD